MSSITVIGFVAAVVLGFLALYHRSAVRTAGRFLLAVLVLLSSASTLALLYGSFALGQKGGGVLIFFAIPFGIVAVISGFVLLNGVREQRDYYRLPVGEKIARNTEELERNIADLQASIARKSVERERFWISARRREQLDREIERERWQLQRLPLLRRPLQSPETYRDDQV